MTSARSASLPKRCKHDKSTEKAVDEAPIEHAADADFTLTTPPRKSEKMAEALFRGTYKEMHKMVNEIVKKELAEAMAAMLPARAAEPRAPEPSPSAAAAIAPKKRVPILPPPPPRAAAAPKPRSEYAPAASQQEAIENLAKMVRPAFTLTNLYHKLTPPPSPPPPPLAQLLPPPLRIN